MQKTFGYRILLFILVAMLTIAVAIIPDIISKDVEAWCKQIFGPNYKFYLLGIMVGGSALVVFFTTDFARGFILGVKKYQQHKFGVPPTEANRSLLKEARTAISQKADTEKALRLLSTIRLSTLDVEIALLSARLVEESRNRHQGVASQDETSRASTRIIRDTLYLIDALEKELSSEQEQDEAIRAYLQKRYSFRLSQKLSGRQPVNLKYIPSTEGTSEETNLYFVFKGDEEIQQGIAQIFRQSKGRLLIVGDPGAGKTTLLLQLVLELLKSELEAIPVMLNLATWKREFITLETWLAEILPTELGVIKRVALELLQQNRLILFLDGFDEIKEEDRSGCLEALGQYSAQAERRFVISSRKNEYSQVAKDAPVYAQIEVRPLALEQMIEELEKVGYDQPEAKPLILALKTDSILGKVAQTPFYFNLLQLLFAEGKRLSDLNFVSTNIAARQNELLTYFLNYSLRPQKNDDYNVENTKRWLAFFASRLERKKIEIFELSTLQYDWWHWSRIQLIFIWIITLLIAKLNIYLPLFISIWVTFIISAGVKTGLAIGVFIISVIFVFIASILIWRHDAPSISTTERINFHWSAIIPFTKASYADVFFPSLFIGIIMGLIGMFILESPKGLIAGILMFILVFIFFSIIMFFESSHRNIIQINFPYQRFNMSSKWLHFSILQHLLLKFQLYISGYLPFNLVQFLDSMGERHILESNGVSWRFHHKLIQNYFTLIWQEYWEVEEWQKFIALKPKNANAHFNLELV